MSAHGEEAQFVTDTHAFIWHVQENPRLSTEARRRFLLADQGDAVVYLSAITPVEILYLVEKERITPKILDILGEKVLSNPLESYQIVDLTYSLALSISKIPRQAVPELSDRIIAATAYHLQLPLITKDHRLQQWEGIVTIW